MNKKLLTIAVGAALAVASGMASAEVMWYGKGDIKIIGGDREQNADGDGTLGLAGEGSRLGIRASEDIGNGMTVKFWHEWAINPGDGNNPGSNDAIGAGVTGTDTDASGDIDSISSSSGQGHAQFGHRDSLLSLEGDFGRIGVGSLAAPTKVIGAGRIDGLFADTVGDLNDGWGYGQPVAQPAGPQLVYGNKVGAVTFAVAYGFENRGTDATWYDGMFEFKAEQFAFGVGYHSADEGANPGGAGADSLINAYGSFTFDSIMLIAGYEDKATEDHGDDDSNTIMLGAKFTFGDNSIPVQYTQKTTDDEAGVTVTSVGFDHNLSKNTAIGVHWSSRSPEDGDTGDDLSSYDLRTTINF